MNKFLSLVILVLSGLGTSNALADSAQGGWLDTLREKLEEAKRKLEESRQTGASDRNTSKESPSWLEQIFGAGKKEESQPTEYREKNTKTEPTWLEQILGMGKKEESKPTHYQEQTSKSTPTWFEQILGTGQKEAPKPTPQPTRSRFEDLRRSEEFQSTAERARREAPNWIERARQYLGIDQKETTRS